MTAIHRTVEASWISQPDSAGGYSEHCRSAGIMSALIRPHGRCKDYAR